MSARNSLASKRSRREERARRDAEKPDEQAGPHIGPCRACGRSRLVNADRHCRVPSCVRKRAQQEPDEPTNAGSEAE